mgnify:CR=1 FL=1
MASAQITWDLNDFYKDSEDPQVEKDLIELLKKSQMQYMLIQN